MIRRANQLDQEDDLYHGAISVEGDSSKLKISSFQGRNDPQAYLK